MADVFVVAIVVAYLAANATKHTEEMFTLTATLGNGFYFSWLLPSFDNIGAVDGQRIGSD